MLSSSRGRMIKIVVNVNRQDVTLTFTVGQAFPKVEGKLVSVEVSGRELQRLQDDKELPLNLPADACLTWNSPHAGRVLRELKELFDV